MIYLSEFDNVFPYLVTAATASIIIFAVFMYFKNRRLRKRHPHSDEFNYSGLIDALGGKGNIISADFHESRLILELADYQLVQNEKLKSIGINGISRTSKKLTLVVGSRSRSIVKYIDALK